MAQQPSIDYLAKDYQSFRQLMLDRLSATLPDWPERHAPDLGIAIVEALAYVADYLSYYQDGVATEAYLGTARRRISIRRHARLLDYILHEGCNARAWLCCTVGKAPPNPVILDPTKISFAAAGIGARRSSPLAASDLPSLPSGSYEEFQPIGCEWGEEKTRDSIELYSELNWFPVQQFEAAGATSATFSDPQCVALRAGRVLMLSGTTPDSSGATEYHPILISEVCRTGSDVIIHWSQDDAIPRKMLNLKDWRACGNVILVEHGHGDQGGSFCTTRLTVIRGRAGPIPRPGLTHRISIASNPQSAAALAPREPDTRLAVPQVKICLDGAPWGQVRADLLESFASDRHFCVEVDNLGQGWIRFSVDKETGERPPEGAVITVNYRIGCGDVGNVPSDSITRYFLREGYSAPDISVTNPMPAVGGSNPESAETARLVAPGEMRANEHRAISAYDYARIALGKGEAVRGAAAIMTKEGSRRIVRVAIAPVAQSAAVQWNRLFDEVRKRLEDVRRINHAVIVTTPTYVNFLLSIEISSLLNARPKDVEQIVKNRIHDTFSSDKLSFGQCVYRSQVVAAIMAAPGVAGVQALLFHRGGETTIDAFQFFDKIKVDAQEIANLTAVVSCKQASEARV